MSDEFLLGVVQLIIYEMQGLAEFHRIGEIAWVGHPKCIASNLTSMLDNCTSHCHFYLFYLVEKEKTELLVETIQHHHLIKCGPLFVDVLFFWGAQERVHIGRQTIITDVGKVMLSLAFIGYGQSS